MKYWNCKEVELGYEEDELQYCCNGYMCGCYGKPIDPPFCDKCMEKVLGATRVKEDGA